MVCLEGGLICVPVNSLTGDALCLPAHLKCNGENDCESGVDELDCIVLTGGIKALIVIVVLVVVVLLPVLYVIVRKKLGKSVIPSCCVPCWAQCHRDKGGDQSSHELASSSHGNVSNSSAEKDGFTNVGFDTGVSTSTERSSSPRDPFGRYKKNGLEPPEEGLHSYREWQTNRLQPPPQSAGQPSPRQPNGISTRPGDATRPAYHVSSDRIPPNAVITSGPVTYSQGASRPVDRGGASAPYAISSKDGQANYEARSHVYQQPANYDSTATRPQQPPSHGQYRSEQGWNGYTRNAGGVPARELREALEKVSYGPSSGSPPSYYQVCEPEGGAAASADTVV